MAKSRRDQSHLNLLPPVHFITHQHKQTLYIQHAYKCSCNLLTAGKEMRLYGHTCITVQVSTCKQMRMSMLICMYTYTYTHSTNDIVLSIILVYRSYSIINFNHH